MGECKKTTRTPDRRQTAFPEAFGGQQEERKQGGEQAAIRRGGLDYMLSFITQPPTRHNTVEGGD